MANKQGRSRRSTEVIFLPRRMTDMLSRTRFDMSRALQGKNWEAFKTAAKTCVHCSAQGECEQWIATHPQGEENPVPGFCPNAHYMASHAPRRVPAAMPGKRKAAKRLGTTSLNSARGGRSRKPG